MRHLLPQSANHPGRSRAFLLAFGTLLTALAIAPHPVQAQVVFDNFDDGDVTDIGAFSGSGGGIGVGTTDGRDGSANSALSVGINPADIGGFAGFVIPGGPGVTDISGASYLSFYVRPSTVQEGNLPVKLEINLHEDVDGNGTYEGGAEDEFQAVYHLSTGTGYHFVQIPLAAFADDNAVFPGADDGFDFANLLEVVIAIGGLGGPEFAFALDEVVFLEQPVELGTPVVPFDFFDDGDVADVGVFSGSGGGIGAGTTDGQDGSANSALSVGVNPADIGGFAGFVVPGGAGTTDASESVYLRFFIQPTTVQEGNLPFTLEINLHEDVDGNGTYEGGTEDEYQAVYRVATGSGYTVVYIPMASFADDNSVFAGLDDGFDFSKLLEIVVAFGGVGGPEFAFALDDIGFFNSASGVAVEPEPSALPDTYVLTNAYPNPFNPQARFELTLQRAQDVSIAIYDMLGRKMEVLHSGVLPAETRHAFQIDGQGWPSGLYWYRVTGESFSDTRSVVLLK